MSILNQGDEEKERIMQEIYREVNKIQELEMGIHNNLYIHSQDDSNDPAVEHVTDCESLRIVLAENQAGSSAVGKENDINSIMKELETEKKCLEFDLARTVKLIQTNKQNIFRANDYMENMKEMLEKSHNQENKSLVTDIIANNVHRRFKAEKRDLRIILNTLFPDNVPIQDLFASILDHYFKEGPDKYLSLDPEDGIAEMIETLIQTTLFEVNPHDYLQIKLADLL